MCFPMYIGTNDSPGLGPILTPGGGGIIGMIYLKHHVALQRTTRTCLGLAVSKKKIFSHVSYYIQKPMADNEAYEALPVWMQGHGL